MVSFFSRDERVRGDCAASQLCLCGFCCGGAATAGGFQLVAGWDDDMRKFILCFCFVDESVLEVKERCSSCCGELKRSSPDQWGLCERDMECNGGAVPAPVSSDDSELGVLGALFPLPYLWRHPRKPRGVSARSRQRYQQKLRAVKWGRRMIDTLNEWFVTMAGTR